MAYKEKYALDITPQGDTVRQSIKKNRDEILEVARTVELKSGGGATGLRNRFLNGKISNGEYSFLTGDNLGVTLDGTQTPVIVSFADGYNEFGAVDYVASIDSKVSAWSVLPNKTQYIYVERTGSGAVSYGSTTVKPVRQSTPPDTVLNAMYYNDIMDMMYVYNGSQWERKQRVLIAEVVTDGTSVKTIKYYQPGIRGGSIAIGSITGLQLANGSIKSVNIGTREIKSTNVDTKAIRAENIADNSIRTQNIEDKSITLAKIGDDVKTFVSSNADEIKGAIQNHETSENAHKKIFDTFVKSVTASNGHIVAVGGNGAINQTQIITDSIDGDTTLGATLGLVKTLLTQTKLRNEDVIKALLETTLSPSGVEYDFNIRNEKTGTKYGYMDFGRLFGGFKVQTGLQRIGMDYTDTSITFPKPFTSFSTVVSMKCGLYNDKSLVNTGFNDRKIASLIESLIKLDVSIESSRRSNNGGYEGYIPEGSSPYISWVAIGV